MLDVSGDNWATHGIIKSGNDWLHANMWLFRLGPRAACQRRLT